MRTDVYRFAMEFAPPQLCVSTLTDRGIGTLQGEYADDPETREALLAAITAELVDGEEIVFDDLERSRTPDMNWLLDRFEDATEGIHPGKPTVKYGGPEEDTPPREITDLSDEMAAMRLENFYRLTGLRPRFAPTLQTELSWGGDTHKLYARIQLPKKKETWMRSLLHELGHCSMSWIGFTKNTTILVDGTRCSPYINWLLATMGLTYTGKDDQERGELLEEAVAEGVGALANRKLGLVRTRYNDEVQTLPEIVAPYMAGTRHFSSAPAAVALELIARELGIPSDRYFRMFVEYATTGVHKMDAREEIAETIYRGTRGRLTMGEIEELPYPVNEKAGLALLWAVEDALDVPDHRRYADLFFRWRA